MDSDAEKRIEAAAQEAARTKANAEFLAGLTKNDELVKPVYNPEAFVMREKYRGAANRGVMKRSECKHPLTRIFQFVDTDPAVLRNDNGVNLFECSICHTPIWFVDPWGEPISDS